MAFSIFPNLSKWKLYTAIATRVLIYLEQKKNTIYVEANVESISFIPTPGGGKQGSKMIVRVDSFPHVIF